MSVYIQTRFYQPSGHYTTAWLGFPTNDISEAANLWKAFACGWEVAGKGRCLWDSMMQTKSGIECYYIPDEAEKLRAFIETFNHGSAR